MRLREIFYNIFFSNFIMKIEMIFSIFSNVYLSNGLKDTAYFCSLVILSFTDNVKNVVEDFRMNSNFLVIPNVLFIVKQNPLIRLD